MLPITGGSWAARAIVLSLPFAIGGCATPPTPPPPLTGEIRHALGVVTQAEQGTRTDSGSSTIRHGLSGPVSSEVYKALFTYSDHIKYTILTEANKEILVESRASLNRGDCVVIAYPASTAADRYYFGLGDATLSKSGRCPAISPK
jgi:hypothetical protein